DNILLALSRNASTVGLAWLSLASGELRVTEIAPQALDNELRRIGPAEVLVAEDFLSAEYFATRLPAWNFDIDSGKRRLLKQLDRAALAGRHGAVACLLSTHKQIFATLRKFSDVERITSRVALKNARPRELAGLRDSLKLLPELQAAIPASPLLDALKQDLV